MKKFRLAFLALATIALLATGCGGGGGGSDDDDVTPVAKAAAQALEVALLSLVLEALLPAQVLAVEARAQSYPKVLSLFRGPHSTEQ